MIAHLISTAMAQAEGAPQVASQPAGNPLVMIFILMAIIYFLVLRPQNKARNEHRSLLASLKKGDKIVTDGGIVGLVHQVEEERVVVEVGDRVRIPFLKDSVKGLYSSADTAKE